MKKKRLIVASIIILVVLTGMTFKEKISDYLILTNSKTASVSAETDTNLSFAVLGDIHENASKLDEVIEDLYKINPDMNALVLNGDVVDQGLQVQYDSIQKVLKNNSIFLPDNLIKNIGNHEFFNYDIDYNEQQDVEDFLNRYYVYSGQNKVYDDTWIEGYHFISLGSESGNTEEFGSTKAVISEEQMNWFKEKLKEGYEQGKPIFVFLHQPINGTYTGDEKTEQGIALKEILSGYPEVIMINSHTHTQPERVNVVYDQPYTVVQTGAVHYSIYRDENGERVNRQDLTYGVYFEVSANKVIIKGRDFESDTWVYTKEVN